MKLQCCLKKTSIEIAKGSESEIYVNNGVMDRLPVHGIEFS